MARKLLGSGAISTFCGSMATMISAGIQIDEATLMLAENRERSHFQNVCNQLYDSVAGGTTLSEAMRQSGAFPEYAIDMVSAGERTGHLENVLRNLELYYDEEDRLFTKLRSSVGYPAALLCIMSVILAFTVIVILPIFTNVYNNMAGSLANGSFSSVGLSATIGWISLIVMVIFAAVSLVLVIITNTPGGRQVVMNLLAKLPQTRQAMYQLDLSRFTAALATLVSSGINDEESMRRAIETVVEADGLSNVRVVVYDGLVADFCAAQDIRWYVRGIRTTLDYSYEENIAQINQRINPNLETLYLRADDAALSSSMIRELIAFHKDVSEYVPQSVSRIIEGA